MLYDTLDEAIVAAEELMDALDTLVKITEAPNGKFELFGSGKLIMVVE